MSGAAEGLSRKIAGARDLKDVVRTMKALAASSIGQYERAVEALHDYYRTVELGLAACLKFGPRTEQGRTLPQARATGAVIFGSDQGLVGRFNDSLLEFAVGALTKLPRTTQHMWAVGERMQALASEAGLPVDGNFAVPATASSIAPLVGQILVAIEAAREEHELGDIYVFHNGPKAGALYEPSISRLLPLDEAWRRKLCGISWPTPALPQIIDATTPALEAFIREYLFILLFQACAQSLASENASRLAAMQRAEKNIEAILDELNRTFHRARHEAIDEELFELIAGFDSLTRPAR